MKILLIILATLYLLAGFLFALFMLLLEMLETSFKPTILVALWFVRDMFLWLPICIKALIDTGD